MPGERKCGSKFDGWNGVLAHAYFPSDGRLHFDEKEWWSAYENHGLFKQPLPQVATHEIGHALGLEHSNVKGSIMWPSCCESTAKLHQDDINGIRKIYGKEMFTRKCLQGVDKTAINRGVARKPGTPLPHSIGNCFFSVLDSRDENHK